MNKIFSLSRISQLLRSPLPVLAGISVTLVGCPQGAQSVKTIDFGEADEISIQPIQVCDNSGNRCARVNLFEDITRKILAQAQLKVSFLPINQIRNTRFLKIQDNPNRSSDDYEFYELSRSGEAGAFGRNPNSTRTSGPINVWFVEEIEAVNEDFTQFGLGWVNANGVLISEAANSFNGTGRPDTLAHEIGHNLGLRHGSLGAGGPNNLLTDGGRRNIPTSAGDVGADGAGVDTLTDAQIAQIKRSGFLTASSSSSSGNEISDSDEMMTSAQINLALRSLSTPQTASANDPAGILVSSAPANTANIPEPATWAALSLFGIILAASKPQGNVRP